MRNRKSLGSAGGLHHGTAPVVALPAAKFEKGLKLVDALML